MNLEGVNIMDSHAHLTSSEYPIDKKKIINRAINSSIKKVINVCTTKSELEEGFLLEKQYPQMIKNIACTTPHDSHNADDDTFQYFEKHALEKNIYGIGETGFDDFIEPDNQMQQKELCRKYIDLGIRAHLPIIFHVRGDKAFDNLFSTASEFESFGGIIHCFTGNKKQLDKALSLDWYISISGVATFKKSSALREVIREVPLDRLLIETDAPWLAPEGYRGKDNEPAYIVKIVEVLAELYHLSFEEICQRTYENGMKIFSLPNQPLVEN